jgi:hypothetical protein
MRLRSIAVTLAFVAISGCAPHAANAQQKPLSRNFVAGAEERFQVTVLIRVETHGISTETVGEKAYAQLYTHEADGEVSWRSTRKIKAVDPDGTAAVEETLDHFAVNCEKDPTSKFFSATLQKSVQDTCAAWQATASFRYEEERLGLMRGLSETTAGVLGSDASLLSLWVRRAFRPSVILPKGPINFGDRAAHRIEGSSFDRTKPEGEESMEWFEAPGETPAATLHVSQNLSWIDSGSKKPATKVGSRPDPRQTFYADSLNTISLLDGSLLKASRSASHETKDTLDPVPGLPDAPTFGSKLTITVTILRLP